MQTEEEYMERDAPPSELTPTKEPGIFRGAIRNIKNILKYNGLFANVINL